MVVWQDLSINIQSGNALISRIVTEEALKRIDSVLEDIRKESIKLNRTYRSSPAKFKAYEVTQAPKLSLRLIQTIMDMSPRESAYWNFAYEIEPPFSALSVVQLYGILEALRKDYADGFLRGFNELIDADLFEDILEQADYLRTQGYVRASAVVAGVALESHLRKLAEKNSIPIKNDKGNFVKAETLKNELYRAGIIDTTSSKSVTYYLGLRNDAAHPDKEEIDGGLLEPMITGIRVLIEKYPA